MSNQLGDTKTIVEGCEVLPNGSMKITEETKQPLSFDDWCKENYKPKVVKGKFIE